MTSSVFFLNVVNYLYCLNIYLAASYLVHKSKIGSRNKPVWILISRGRYAPGGPTGSQGPHASHMPSHWVIVTAWFGEEYLEERKIRSSKHMTISKWISHCTVCKCTQNTINRKGSGEVDLTVEHIYSISVTQAQPLH